MRMRWNAVVLTVAGSLALSAWPGVVQADETATNNLTKCRAETASAALRCVAEQHPELITATAELKRYAAEVERAEQSPNPEFGSRVLGGADTLTAEASFEHTFETAGKREARIEVAEQNFAMARSHFTLRRVEIIIRSARHLYSLRRLADEIRYLRESERAFQNAIWRFRRRPALSGEQQASYASYEVALADVRVRIDRAVAEQNRLATELSYATTLNRSQLEQVAAEITAPRWPEAAGLREPPADADPTELRLARDRVAWARAVMEQEEAEAFPNLSIGPAVGYSRSSTPSGGIFGGTTSSSETEVGLSFRVTIPLYHTNEAGQDAARAAVAAEETRAISVRDRLQLERARLVNEYASIRQTLERSMTFDALGLRHRRIQVAIAGGQVSAATVIEFHRSMIEYVHEFREREDAALLALLSIYVMDGRLLMEVERDGIF